MSRIRFRFTSTEQIRREFWQGRPREDHRKLAGDYTPEVREQWVNFLDSLHRDGSISSRLAFNATLS